MQIGHAVGQPSPGGLVDTGRPGTRRHAGDEFVHHVGEALAPFLRGPVAVVDADQPESVGQPLGGHQIVERRRDQALGQVAAGAEDHHGAGRRDGRGLGLRRGLGLVDRSGLFAMASCFLPADLTCARAAPWPPRRPCSGSKPNLRCSSLSGAEAPKVFMPMTRPSVADIALPAQRRSLLDGDARLHAGRQHLLAIGLRLVLEDVPGRHRDDAGANPLGRQRFMGLDDQRDLAARGDEDDLGRAARRVRHDIGAARDAGRRGVLAAVERRQRLARQRDHRRLVAQLQDVAIGLDDLVGVARPQHDQAGNGAQRDELLDRLMRRSILAVAHGVMGEDEDGRQLHEGGEPNGRPGIVAEDEEGRAEGPQLGQRQAVHDRRHGVLADAEMEIAAAGAARARSRRRRRTSASSCSTGRGRPSRRGTRECSGRARSAPRPRRRVRRCPWDRPGSSAGCGPIPRAARAAASGRSRWRAPGTACGSRQRAPPSAAAPRRRARRCRRRSAPCTPSGTRNLASSGQP